MIVVIVNKDKNIEKALKEYKSKVIKTRQMSKLNDRKEYISNVVYQKSS